MQVSYYLRDPRAVIFSSLAVLGLLIYVAIFPYPLFSFEYNQIQNMAQFFTYTVSFFVPIAFAVRILYNPVAGRAINPVTRRFIPLATPIMLIFIFAIMWFLVLGWLTIQFELSFIGMISPTFDADLSFLFLMIFVYLLLPILCLALVLPGGFSRNMSSIGRHF